MKKKIAILTLVFYLFTSVIVQPQQKTYAFAFAPPLATGGIALGALALGGIATYIGLENFGEDISEWGNKVWENTSDVTKNAFNSVVSWVENTQTLQGVPSLEIDYSSLTTDVRETLSNTATTSYIGSLSVGNASTYEKDAESIEIDVGGGLMIPTQYPQAIPKSLFKEQLTFSLNDSNFRYLSVFPNGVTGLSTEISLNHNYADKSNYEMRGEGFLISEPNKLLKPMFEGINVAKNYWNVPIASVKTFELMREEIYNSTGILVSVVSSDFAMGLRQASFSEIRESWESMLDAGIVIDGSAILEANPNITWDGQSFVDSTGVTVPTDNLTLPRVGIKDGVIGYPVAGDWVDVTTGVPVGTGEGAIPGEGGSTGILQGLWDWLKGILQSILDAIKALAGLLGLIALIESIGSLIAAIVEVLTTGLIGDTSKVNWDKLKMAGSYFTTKFPFSLPWDVGRALTAVFGQFDSQNVPSYELKFYNHSFEIRLPQMMIDWFPITRAMILIAFDIGLLYSVRKLLGGAS